MQLSDLDTLALAKAVPSDVLKNARQGVEPGVYDVDLVVHVLGRLKVAQDYEQPFANTVPWAELVAFLLEQLPAPTRGRMLRLFFEEGERAGKSRHVEQLCKELVGQTRRPCKGRVQPELHVEYDGAALAQTSKVG